MRLDKVILYIIAILIYSHAEGQYVHTSTQQTIEHVERLQLQNKSQEALQVLESSIATSTSPDDLAYLYAHQSGLYVSRDSFLIGKKLLDLSFENAKRSTKKTSNAIAFRAKAYLNNAMNLPDETVKDALIGLKYLEGNDEDLTTKYHLNYLLYSAYSKWNDEEKMNKYIRVCQDYAIRTTNINLQANVNNGIFSMYLAQYEKAHQANLLDSTLQYLRRSFALYQQNPDKVSGNTLVITCINLANYYLRFFPAELSTRKQKAFEYLYLAEEKLKKKEATDDKWVNVLGIKSSFAAKRGELALAERYLIQGLAQLANTNSNHFKLKYTVNKELAAIAWKKDDPKSALNYQRKAEELLKKTFDEQQVLNAQKLEIQYETEKKDQQLKLLSERAELRRKQNYLYGGVTLALIFGFIFMFISYHFKLKYSIERGQKLAKEKEDAEQRAKLQLKIEKEEQARLKAEQELLDLKRQQLEKEALANSLIIEHKNDMLKQIKAELKEGDSKKVQQLLNANMLLNNDFERVKLQVQQLHPTFFNQLREKAVQKLTALDLKYCAYLHLQMTTKQIAQALHVAPQSVRMFKYRLKQKFNLTKESDLDTFLRELF